MLKSLVGIGRTVSSRRRVFRPRASISIVPTQSNLRHRYLRIEFQQDKMYSPLLSHCRTTWSSSAAQYPFTSKSTNNMSSNSLLCLQSPDATAWLDTCKPLFDSDKVRHNIPWGFGEIIKKSGDPAARFAYVKDSASGAVIQAVLLGVMGFPTVFSAIKDEENYDVTEIATLMADFMLKEGQRWNVTDCWGEAKFVEAFCKIFNARQAQQAPDSHLVLWRYEKWSKCSAIAPELSAAVKSSDSLFRFEKATLSQMDSLVPLRAEFIRPFSPHKPTEDEIKKWITQNCSAGKLFVLMQGDDTIVSVVASGRGTEDYESIIMVFTPEQYRGKGLATQIVVKLTESLLQEGKKAALLSIDQRNQAAVNLYRKLGYTTVMDVARFCIPSLVTDINGQPVHKK